MKTAEEKAIEAVNASPVDELNESEYRTLVENVAKALKERDRDTRHACRELKPMHLAPRGVEILAYHKEGKNFHQVKWKDYKERWGMRWNTEYSQSDFNYIGWAPMPEVEFV